MITPPVGLNLFVTAGVAKLSVLQIVCAALPFVGILFLFLVTFWPPLSTWLPTLMMGPEIIIKRAPRDPERLGGDPAEQVDRRTARLIRAHDNHVEALILFAVAVLVVTLGEASGPVTDAYASISLGARVLCVPAYAFGWVPWRSLIWAIGQLATTVMLIAALL